MLLPFLCDTIFLDRHGIRAVLAVRKELEVEGVRTGPVSRLNWQPGIGRAVYAASAKEQPELAETRSAAEGKGKDTVNDGYAVKAAERGRAFDSVEFMASRESVSEDAVLDYLRGLKKDYPGVTILIQDREDAGDLKQLAASLGKGRFLVVTKEFLERMGRDEGEYERCKAELRNMADWLALKGDTSLSDGVYLDAADKKTWMVPAAGKQNSGQNMKFSGPVSLLPGHENGVRRSELDVRRHVSVSYATSSHYGSLARAGTKGEVQKVLGDVHRSIGNLRLASCFGSEEERVKAGRAIRSLQKLLARGNKKIKRLDQESNLKRREKHAEKARKEKKVLQIRLEMKKRRAARYRADYGLVQEGRADSFYILGAGKHRTWEEERAEQEIQGMGVMGDGFSSPGFEGGGAVSFDASNVVISDGGSF